MIREGAGDGGVRFSVPRGLSHRHNKMRRVYFTDAGVFRSRPRVYKNLHSSFILPWRHQLEVVAVRVGKCRNPKVRHALHRIRRFDHGGPQRLYPGKLSFHVRGLHVDDYALGISGAAGHFRVGSNMKKSTADFPAQPLSVAFGRIRGLAEDTLIKRGQCFWLAGPDHDGIEIEPMFV